MSGMLFPLQKTSCLLGWIPWNTDASPRNSEVLPKAEEALAQFCQSQPCPQPSSVRRHRHHRLTSACNLLKASLRSCMHPQNHQYLEMEFPSIWGYSLTSAQDLHARLMEQNCHKCLLTVSLPGECPEETLSLFSAFTNDQLPSLDIFYIICEITNVFMQ